MSSYKYRLSKTIDCGTNAGFEYYGNIFNNRADYIGGKYSIEVCQRDIETGKIYLMASTESNSLNCAKNFITNYFNH